MNDSLYAIDANNGSVLWQLSLFPPGATATPGTDTACGNISPTLGITGTPVIDPSTGTIYLVAFTKENGTYVHRLHAIDIATHAEKFGGPVVVNATVPGSGSGTVGGSISFNPLHSNQRAGLLLQNGIVTIAWASYCDHSPFHGWIISYNATTLAQQAVFNTTPNGSGGGVWMSGAGLAADANSSIYLATGNGDENASLEWGDSILKLSGPGSGSFAVADWFTPYDQQTLDVNDWDLGAGGVLLLPNLPSGQQLLVQASKKGTIYLVDRNSMGKYCSTCTSTGGDTQIVQVIPNALTGMWVCQRIGTATSILVGPITTVAPETL
jgi:hypothetical protein